MPLLIAVFLLFSLFRDRVEALQALRSYSPLSRKESDLLLERIRSMVHATVLGSLTVAWIQDERGGLMFWILGLPSVALGRGHGAMRPYSVAGDVRCMAAGDGPFSGAGKFGESVDSGAVGLLVVSVIDNPSLPDFSW